HRPPRGYLIGNNFQPFHLETRPTLAAMSMKKESDLEMEEIWDHKKQCIIWADISLI
ncbi:hypothetical protein Bpfe_013833, partial [Biomphalaria pfeifferi]